MPPTHWNDPPAGALRRCCICEAPLGWLASQPCNRCAFDPNARYEAPTAQEDRDDDDWGAGRGQP